MGANPLIEDKIQSILLQVAAGDEGLGFRLEGEDILDLFRAVIRLQEDLSLLKIENSVLESFLQSVEPKPSNRVSISVETKSKSQRIKFAETTKDDSSTRYAKRKFVKFESDYLGKGLPSSKRFFSGVSMHTFDSRPSMDWKLSYAIRSNLVDKQITEIENRCKQLEDSEKEEVIHLNAKITETECRNEEIDKTMESFEKLVVMGEDMLPKVSSEKFIKYFRNWLQSGMALVSTMRVKLAANRAQCLNLHSTIVKKTDLRGVLHTVDFHILQTKNEIVKARLRDGNAHLQKVTQLTSDVSLKLTKQKDYLKAAEIDLRIINAKIAETKKKLADQDEEIAKVEKEFYLCKTNLEKLIEESEKYEAPSISEYIAKKEELIALEKEEKILNRKINLLKIKKENARKKLIKKKGGKLDYSASNKCSCKHNP